ncbi:UV-stimulated scaffold protein A-like isoform X1 [Branchiostoma lanceolatum]|uniref:UV-stimulated scaffold protein A-like isoform X1 n=1 Tax=Branchiostoma lanceolatum TaxID=7740 RepID=UPI0034513C1F
MDLTVCQQLEKLVEDLTTSGQHQLDKATVKTLKKICKTSDEYVKHTYHLLNMQLQKDHAEIRLSAFQTMDELFQRSHAFRELLIAEFQEFLELTVESNYDFPLPPPKGAADKLKKQALQAIQRWQEQFGEAYKKLTLGYNFLRYNRKVDFNNIAASSNVERTRQEQERARIQAIKLQRAKNALKEMEETKPEIDECLTQAESCFQLLVPRNDAMDLNITPPKNGDQDTNNTLPTTSHGWKQSRKEQHGKDINSDVFMKKEQARVQKPLIGEGSLMSGDRERVNDGDSLKVSTGDGQEGDSEEDSDDDEEDVVRHHGLGSHKYNISIEFNPDDSGIREDRDNADIMDTLRDMNKLIVGRFQPAVGRWLEVFSKAGTEQKEIKRAIDIKQALTAASEKCAELGILAEQKTNKQQQKEGRKGGQDDSSDDDFVEVEEKEGYEPRIPDALRAEYGLEPAKSETKTKPSALKPRTVPAPASTAAASASAATTSGTKPPTKKSWHPFLSGDNNPSDPTSYSAALSTATLQPSQDNRGEKRKVGFDAQPSTSRASPTKRELLAKAPVVPFGMDLYTWGEKARKPTIVRDESLHRFWRPSDEGEIEVNRLDPSKERTITFVGEFEPVKWTCKAPLSNGKLCPRMDRCKCPFHGPIIPRDETGKPANPKDAEREERRRMEQQLAETEVSEDWRDPELQRDIEAATGIAMGTISGRGKGKGKGKGKKLSNLTDLKKVKNTTRRRLERKVFNSGSVKRVATEMNKLDQRRYNDKFGNQFNYALN